MSSIPLSIVERIEILKDGASAIYGSDAIAGVVNIIMAKDIDNPGQPYAAQGDLQGTLTAYAKGSQQAYAVLRSA